MNRKRLRRFFLLATMLVIIAAVAAMFIPLPPHGRFSYPSIGTTAPAYFEAANGKFTLVVSTGEKGREDEEERRIIGEYRKEHGRWLLIAPSGSTWQLRATLLSLDMIESNGYRDGPFYRHGIYTGR